MPLSFDAFIADYIALLFFTLSHYFRRRQHFQRRRRGARERAKRLCRSAQRRAAHYAERSAICARRARPSRSADMRARVMPCDARRCCQARQIRAMRRAARVMARAVRYATYFSRAATALPFSSPLFACRHDARRRCRPRPFYATPRWRRHRAAPFADANAAAAASASTSYARSRCHSDERCR